MQLYCSDWCWHVRHRRKTQVDERRQEKFAISFHSPFTKQQTNILQHVLKNDATFQVTFWCISFWGILTSCILPFFLWGCWKKITERDQSVSKVFPLNFIQTWLLSWIASAFGMLYPIQPYWDFLSLTYSHCVFFSVYLFIFFHPCPLITHQSMRFIGLLFVM